MARKLVVLFLALGLCSFLGMAQSKEYSRIARVSYLEGKVSFQHTDEVEWTAASINMALQPGDRIYTSDNGRAEIEFDDGSVVRLAEKTDVEILTMREQLIQLKVLIGLCSLTDRSAVQFEIATPAAAFTTLENGSYRFDIAENGDSDGIVRKGSLEAVNNQFSRRIVSGEVLHVPAAEGSTEVLARYDQRDAWDEWNDRRNAEDVATESRRYIADNVSYGVSDLDRYGSWTSVDGYGPAWMPRVGFGWSPYNDGRWVYRPLWGWTWVSYEPWGWLPYHYGRWYYASAGWCWIPGPSFSFHFWSPGLVRFYRGSSYISWCPLGPGDYYDINNYYFNSYNRANIYYLNELRLMQRRGPDDLLNRNRGFRSVHVDSFLNGVGGARVESGRIADTRQLGRLVSGSLDLRPTAQSYAPAPGRASERPSGRSRPVVVRTEPEFKARGDRYVSVTNPDVVSRSRADQPGTRDLRAQPGAGMPTVPNRTSGRVTTDRSVPDRGTADRNASPARTYQVPQSRPSTGQGQVTPRIDTRTAPATSRRVDSPPPSSNSPSRPSSSSPRISTPSRSVDMSPPRSFSAPSSVSSPPSVSSQPSVSPPATSSPAVSRPAAPPPASSGAGAAPPVKKAPEPDMSSGYAPRQYQSNRSTARPAYANDAPARVYSAPAAAESQARSSGYAARSVDVPSSYRQSSPERGVSRQSVQDYSPARSTPQYSAPRSVAPQYSEPRNAAPQYSSPRNVAPQYSAPRSVAPQYSEPRNAAPQYSAPRNVAPQYSAPRNAAPQYSAPRQSSRPSPQFSAPRSSSPSSGSVSRPSSRSGTSGSPRRR